MEINSITNESGTIVMETVKRKDWVVAHKYFDEEGRLHKDPKHGPAFIMFYQTGDLLCVKYYEHGLKHRDKSEGPAYIVYNPDGSIYNSEYWENNKNEF